jgi:hypothetical protein
MKEREFKIEELLGPADILECERLAADRLAYPNATELRWSPAGIVCRRVNTARQQFVEEMAGPPADVVAAAIRKANDAAARDRMEVAYQRGLVEELRDQNDELQTQLKAACRENRLNYGLRRCLWVAAAYAAFVTMVTFGLVMKGC